MKHLPKSIQKKCHTDNETIHTTSTISMIYEWDLLVIQIIARIYSLSWYSRKTQLKTIILRLIWHYCFKGKRTLNLLGLRTCFSDNLWHSKHLIMKKKKLWNLTKETIYPSSNLQIHEHKKLTTNLFYGFTETSFMFIHGCMNKLINMIFEIFQEGCCIFILLLSTWLHLRFLFWWFHPHQCLAL